jgi:hypothetical protein
MRYGRWWQVGDARRKRFTPILRSDAIAFSKNPRPSGAAKIAAALRVEDETGAPVLVSAAFLNAECSAWLGTYFEDARPPWILQRIGDGLLSGQPFLAGCYLQSAKRTPRRYKGVFLIEVVVERDEQLVPIYRTSFRLTRLR